jgi:hypothetical protein
MQNKAKTKWKYILQIESRQAWGWAAAPGALRFQAVGDGARQRSGSFSIWLHMRRVKVSNKEETISEERKWGRGAWEAERSKSKPGNSLQSISSFPWGRGSQSNHHKVKRWAWWLTGRPMCWTSPHFPQALNPVWGFAVTVTSLLWQASIREARHFFSLPHIS